MSELPENWSKIDLLEVSELVRGVTYSKDDVSDTPNETNVSVFRANNITKNGITFVDLVYVPSRLVSENQRVKSGDVIIATSSGSISVVGKAAQAKENLNAGFGAFCGLLRPDSHIHKKYFGYYFSSEVYRNYVSSVARGVNINNLKREHFENIVIPLPPLLEQQRIADKLEQLLERVTQSAARLETALTAVKRFRQAVLAAATSGKLTEDLFLDSSRTVTNIGSVCKLVNGFAFSSSDYRKEGIPILRISDIDGRFATPSEDVFVSPELFNEKFLVSKGDILVAMSGATTGKVGIYQSDEICLQNQRVGNLKISNPEKITSGYRNIVLTASGDHILRSAYGGAQPNISSKDIEAFEISLPSLLEQLEIVRRVETLFAHADALEGRIRTARAALNRLTPSILAKAFRGELVPQDPTDEPASKLLERIRAAKAAAPVKTRKVALVSGSNRKLESSATSVSPRVTATLEPRKRGRPAGAKNRIIPRDAVTDTHLTDLLRAGGSVHMEALWQESGLDFAAFFAQLKTEAERGLIAETKDLERGLTLLSAV